jgi:homoserine/homoserine lactone efflux protein
LVHASVHFISSATIVNPIDTLTFGGIPAHVYWLYVVTEAMVSLAPGPAVLLVASLGLACGVRVAWAAGLGILSANALLFTLSAFGLSAVVTKVPALFAAFKWGGIAYILWMAWGAWTARPGSLSIRAERTMGALQAWRTAVLLQLSNPKCWLTFLAVVPPFVQPEHPVPPQMFWLAMGSLLPEVFILGAYGKLAAQAQHLAQSPERLQLIDRICAVLLAACAVAVAFA